MALLACRNWVTWRGLTSAQGARLAFRRVLNISTSTAGALASSVRRRINRTLTKGILYLRRKITMQRYLFPPRENSCSFLPSRQAKCNGIPAGKRTSIPIPRMTSRPASIRWSHRRLDELNFAPDRSPWSFTLVGASSVRCTSSAWWLFWGPKWHERFFCLKLPLQKMEFV